MWREVRLLNINLDSIYFKDLRHLRERVLTPIKKDLLNTDVIMSYEIIKMGRKNTHIKFYTKLNMEKFAQQKKKYMGKLRIIMLIFKKNHSKQILNDIDKDSKIVWDSK